MFGPLIRHVILNASSSSLPTIIEDYWVPLAISRRYWFGLPIFPTLGHLKGFCFLHSLLFPPAPPKIFQILKLSFCVITYSLSFSSFHLHHHSPHFILLLHLDFFSICHLASSCIDFSSKKLLRKIKNHPTTIIIKINNLSTFFLKAKTKNLY